MIRTNRSIVKYILLTIITCGIYALWYQHKIAQDINTICDGDGKHTGGLLKFFILGVVTLGVYILIWYFGVANRLISNAERYGVKISGDGKIVLLWRVFGVFLFGVGPFVAENIIMENTNILADAYNKQHYGNKQWEPIMKREQKLEGECRWYILLVSILAFVSTQISFAPPILEDSFAGTALSFLAVISLEWEQNLGLCLLGCGSICFFYFGIMLYVLSAILLLLRRKREVGTSAILAYYCSLVTSIVFFALDTKLFEYISSVYLIIFCVLNVVAIIVLSKNNEVT